MKKAQLIWRDEDLRYRLEIRYRKASILAEARSIWRFPTENLSYSLVMDTYESKAKLPSIARLILVRVKIERAKMHLSELESEALKWAGATTYAKLTETDAAGNEYQVFKSVKQVSFNIVAAAGDLIQNLHRWITWRIN